MMSLNRSARRGASRSPQSLKKSLLSRSEPAALWEPNAAIAKHTSWSVTGASNSMLLVCTFSTARSSYMAQPSSALTFVTAYGDSSRWSFPWRYLTTGFFDCT
jgi:hypothetical protein